MKKKVVLFVLPVICLFFLASGLVAKEKPVTIQELFEDLPYYLVFHDNAGMEYHFFKDLTGVGYADTYLGWIEDSTGYVYFYDAHMWVETTYFSFVVTGITNDSWWGYSITGYDWTGSVWVNCSGSYFTDIAFYKGPITSGFKPTFRGILEPRK